MKKADCENCTFFEKIKRPYFSKDGKLMGTYHFKCLVNDKKCIDVNKEDCKFMEIYKPIINN